MTSMIVVGVAAITSVRSPEPSMKRATLKAISWR